jgi:hypothetical protein
VLPKSPSTVSLSRESSSSIGDATPQYTPTGMDLRDRCRKFLCSSFPTSNGAESVSVGRIADVIEDSKPCVDGSQAVR